MVQRLIESLNENILSFAWSGDGRLLAISHSSGLISLVDVMCNLRNLTQIVNPKVCGMVKFSTNHRFIFCRVVNEIFHPFFASRL